MVDQYVNLFKNSVIKHSITNGRGIALDYYADGVVRMGYDYFNNFIIRTVTIEKLRGVSIGSSPIYLYSLDSGHFQSFKREQIVYPAQRMKKIVKAEDRDSSSGSISSMFRTIPWEPTFPSS